VIRIFDTVLIVPVIIAIKTYPSPTEIIAIKKKTSPKLATV
jgi:hypothetical protein